MGKIRERVIANYPVISLLLVMMIALMPLQNSLLADISSEQSPPTKMAMEGMSMDHPCNQPADCEMGGASGSVSDDCWQCENSATSPFTITSSNTAFPDFDESFQSISSHQVAEVTLSTLLRPPLTAV